VDLVADTEPGALEVLVAKSGGLPRDAVKLAYFAVDAALEAGAGHLEVAHARAGVLDVAKELGTGLGQEDLRLLHKLRHPEPLPQDDDGRAARLYADGRIIALPVTEEVPVATFLVHPLLEPAVEWFDRRTQTGGGEPAPG
jgi:hypothetical protein